MTSVIAFLVVLAAVPGSFPSAFAGEEEPAPPEKEAASPEAAKDRAPAEESDAAEKETAPEDKPAPETQPAPDEPAGNGTGEKGAKAEEETLSPEERVRRDVRRRILSAPLKGGRNAFLHALVYIPPLRAGSGLAVDVPGGLSRPAGVKKGTASLSFELTGSREEEGTHEIDTTHFESALNLRYAVTDLVEFHGSLCADLMAGDVDFTWQGAPMEPKHRHEEIRLSRLVLGTKFDLLPLAGNLPDIWAALDFKIQATDKDLADAGRPGVALSLLMSQAFGPVHVHLNVGWALSDGQENFPKVFNPATYENESIRVDRIFHWGLSGVWTLGDAFALVLQVLGNTNGFKELPFLDSDVHVLAAGARYLHASTFAELAGGFGLTSSSADYFLRLEIGVLF